jgi:hypothetical protein
MIFSTSGWKHFMWEMRGRPTKDLEKGKWHDQWWECPGRSWRSMYNIWDEPEGRVIHARKKWSKFWFEQEHQPSPERLGNMVRNPKAVQVDGNYLSGSIMSGMQNSRCCIRLQGE